MNFFRDYCHADASQRRGSASQPAALFKSCCSLSAAAFLALHALHLNADFPNHSPWMDWSKYTDEGWYGDGAIRHFQRGHWYVPGDFNPAAALPVWPLLEVLLFRFTGVSLAAARALTVAVFALILVSSYLLLRRWPTSHPTYLVPDRPSPTPSLAPAIAVLLLAVSPFCYAFTRLAILEPLLILLTLLALLTTSYLCSHRSREAPNTRPPYPVPRTSHPVLLGLLLPLMVLTKTTAIFLLPAIAWLLWARAGYRLRPFLRISLFPVALAAALWLAYYAPLVRPHFLPDYHYLFSANAYTGITSVHRPLRPLRYHRRRPLDRQSSIPRSPASRPLIAVLHPRLLAQPARPRAPPLGRRLRRLPRLSQQPPAPVLPRHRRPAHASGPHRLREHLAAKTHRPHPSGKPTRLAAPLSIVAAHHHR